MRVKTAMDKKVTIKDIIMAANKATLYSLPWSSETWLDIVEEILIKLSIILYPFCFIFYIGKILFNLNKKAKDEEVN